MFLAILMSLLMIGAPVSADSFWQTVKWQTTDGVRMVGEYHPSARSHAYTWVLLHGLGSSKGEWDVFPRKVAAQGGGIFIYDLRGHADSVALASGGTITYKDWQSAGPGSPWDAMASDLASAVKLLRTRFALPEGKIAVGGASLGANVALVYASEHAEVPALILLSPGMEYAGIQSAPCVSSVSRSPCVYRGKPGPICTPIPASGSSVI